MKLAIYQQQKDLNSSTWIVWISSLLLGISEWWKDFVWMEQEGSPRRSLSALARESRDDYSPFTPDSRDSGFGQNSQEELKLFSIAMAAPGTLLTHRSYDSQDEESNSTGLVIGDELTHPDPVRLSKDFFFFFFLFFFNFQIF